MTQASLDTDSEDDRLPPFSENVVATSNDHADKCEAGTTLGAHSESPCYHWKALHGGPWDLDDLQGVWFLSEASPKDRVLETKPLHLHQGIHSTLGTWEVGVQRTCRILQSRTRPQVQPSMRITPLAHLSMRVACSSVLTVQVRLQFGSTVEITFLSDGERQRFRRHLAGCQASMTNHVETSCAPDANCLARPPF